MGKKWLWFLVKALVGLILVGLLVAGGFAIHYVSWSQGYTAGQQAAEGEEAVAPLPYLHHGLERSGRLGLVRPLLCVGVLLLALVVVCGFFGGIFRMLSWKRMACGPWGMGRHWGHHPGLHRRAHRRAKHGHGHVPPWCWDWEEPEGEEADEAGDEADAEG